MLKIYGIFDLIYVFILMKNNILLFSQEITLVFSFTGI